ncbi:MAG: ABC transporter substrate-binding protein [Planctomycetota bacterium]
MARPLARLALTLLGLGVAACGGDVAEPGVRVLRVGHFPTVTHAQGLAAHALTREGQGWFEQRLGPGTKVEWFLFNAGPSAMESILSGAIDLTYVGPNPAINAHVRSRGREIRVVAGAARGGAALVVQGDGRIASPADFRGKKVATPQLGNTQDVACRAWLAAQGFEVTQTGGDVHVVPTQSSDILALFLRGEIDAAWTVEPWVSRLESEAGGKILVEEKDAIATVLVASTRFLREEPELARAFVDAHDELTRWIGAHPDEAKALVRAELAAETTREMPQALVDRCWARIRFDQETSLTAFESFVEAAQAAGFLKEAGDLSRLLETSP